MTRPRIGITLGDPAGIGSEILAKSLAQLAEICTPVVFGTNWCLEAGYDVSGISVDQYPELIDVGMVRPNDFTYGEVSGECGRIALESVYQAIDAAIKGEIDAMMTCPINKEAIHAAGSQDIGHQEILGRLTNVQRTATMLMTPGLRVVHLSTHKSLAEAVRFVTRENVYEKLELIHSSFEKWGFARPRIAVAALNPHGGEGGLLGSEEIEELKPAVEDAVVAGINAVGPLPADSVFYRAIDGEFAVVLALYHDQGHIAIKVHNFHESVSATLGLPFIRTSVDHGTAFDIAGKGIAAHQSVVSAVEAAVALATAKFGGP